MLDNRCAFDLVSNFSDLLCTYNNTNKILAINLIKYSICYLLRVVVQIKNRDPKMQT